LAGEEEMHDEVEDSRVEGGGIREIKEQIVL
jgi:hypothetical protein